MRYYKNDELVLHKVYKCTVSGRNIQIMKIEEGKSTGRYWKELICDYATVIVYDYQLTDIGG